MHIILNSDVIFSKSLRRAGLPKHIVDFLTKCANAHHEIIIPETTKIEFDKEQERVRADLVGKLNEASELLKSNGIEVPAFAAEELITNHGLEFLLANIKNLKFSVVEATLEDYKIALRKACVKESPHPPDGDGDSDEMRDLVIWQTAIRLSNELGGAILVSRDKVHTHHRGDVEASDAKLLRAKEFDKALEMMDLETTSSAIIRELLHTQWAHIVASELPLVQGAAIISIRNPIFTGNEDDTTTIFCEIGISAGNGNHLECDAELIEHDKQLLKSKIKDNGSGKSWSFEVGGADTESDFAERLSALQQVLEQS